MSSSSTSPPKRSPIKGSAAPSLLILTPDDVLTKFQRRRFNPEDFNIFDRFKTNPFGPGGCQNLSARGTFNENDGFGDDWNSRNSRRGGHDSNLRSRGKNIIDLASLGSDFDLNSALRQNGNSSFDIASSAGQFARNGANDMENMSNASTSAYSVYPGDEELYKKLQRQLNLGLFGNMFQDEFDNMDEKKKRQLGRVARLQTAQKRNWYNGIWQLFDLLDDQQSTDRLWQTLRLFMKPDGDDDEDDVQSNAGKRLKKGECNNKKKTKIVDGIEVEYDSDDEMRKAKRNRNEADSGNLNPVTSDPVANSLMKSAKRVFESFLQSNRAGLNLFMRASITGPKGSGKSIFLRSILIRVLNFLVEGGKYKSFFIVPLDFSRIKKIKTATDYYNYVAQTTIDALLVQRTDLQLFQNSLRKAFSILTTVPHMKRLPKPISSQDYLRASLKQVDILLATMHKCYNDPDLLEAFITNVAVLPQTLGDIFNFDTTFQVIDHIDLADVEIRRKNKPPIQLFEYVKFGLSQTQFLISCIDSERLAESSMALDSYSYDLRFSTQMITVYDICRAKNNNDKIIVKFANNPDQPVLNIFVDQCGGCPAFILAFDEVCNAYLKMKAEFLPNAIDERKIIMIKKAEDLIHILFQVKEVPKIEDVTLVDFFEEEDEDEENNETDKIKDNI